MDKYEYKLKLEQIQNLFAAGDYLTAAEMADTINWKKVRSSTTLCMVGEIYEKSENRNNRISSNRNTGRALLQRDGDLYSQILYRKCNKYVRNESF